MKIRIDKIYGTFRRTNPIRVGAIVRCYVNGKCRYERLYFDTEQEVRSLKEGSWIDY